MKRDWRTWALEELQRESDGRRCVALLLHPPNEWVRQGSFRSKAEALTVAFDAIDPKDAASRIENPDFDYMASTWFEGEPPPESSPWRDELDRVAEIVGGELVYATWRDEPFRYGMCVIATGQQSAQKRPKVAPVPQDWRAWISEQVKNPGEKRSLRLMSHGEPDGWHPESDFHSSSLAEALATVFECADPAVLRAKVDELDDEEIGVWVEGAPEPEEYFWRSELRRVARSFGGKPVFAIWSSSSLESGACILEARLRRVGAARTKTDRKPRRSA